MVTSTVEVTTSGHLGGRGARGRRRGVVRAAVAIGWALAPSLLDALVTGRPTVVIAHLLLPWLLFMPAILLLALGPLHAIAHLRGAYDLSWPGSVFTFS